MSIEVENNSTEGFSGFTGEMAVLAVFVLVLLGTKGLAWLVDRDGVEDTRHT